MGCNIPDIKYTILFGVPKSKSLSTVTQRWGRAGRDRTTQAVCLLLVPKWAFRPASGQGVAHHQLECGRRTKKTKESKKETVQCANLDERLENFINIGSPGLPGNEHFLFDVKHILIFVVDCAHKFLWDEFSPNTGLTLRHSLDDNRSSNKGFRSKDSPFELTWTVLNLEWTPPAMRCCYRCNPDLVLPFVASDKHDSRLSAFTNDFTFGAVVSRPGSSASTRTDVSNTSSFTPARHAVKVTKEDQERLCQQLIKWRDKKHEESGSPLFLSAQILFPPKQLNSFVTQCDRFLLFA